MWKLMQALAVVAAGFAVQAVPASALSVTVSDVNLIKVLNTINLTWNAAALTNDQLKATPADFGKSNVGDVLTIQYGTFTANDFPISFLEELDILDSLTVSMDLTPPVTLFGEVLKIASVRGDFVQGASGSMTVNFNNNESQITLSDGTKYSWWMNDLNFTSNTVKALTLSLRLDNKGTPGNPVPEPTTMALAGVGLASAVLGRGKASRRA